MSVEDRRRWDSRYAAGQGPIAAEPGLPAAFASYEAHFPAAGRALDVACGTGGASVWLALRGMTVQGIDVSRVAIELATELAARSQVGDRCRFAVADLDGGLPEGPKVDLVLCHMFRGCDLDRSLIARLAPAGLLAVARLSEVGAEPGRFRAPSGELRDAFGHLEVIDEGEADGRAWLLARAPM